MYVDSILSEDSDYGRFHHLNLKPPSEDHLAIMISEADGTMVLHSTSIDED